MKTQISRNSFKAAKRYSGVYQQQGRMLTDADWNNLVDVLKGHLAEALKDVVGDGSPRTGKLKITTDRQIQPGDLYVGGLRAELSDTAPIDADKQPDFPGSPNLPETGPYIVYADVWERSLTALEDPDLRDAALNGADTCTRTQTMLQVKICPEDLDPEKDISQHGDAALTLTLHDNQESDDPCDPCAGLVENGEGRIGNYLFRLEVHAVEGTEGNPTGLILKWSSENGAEQYEAQEEPLMPPGFVVSGRFIYEFFDLDSEKHLGMHLNPDPDFEPSFGELKQTYVIPNEEPYVRRWDGYCKLAYDGSDWSLVEGFDKGVDLSAEGRTSVDSTTLSVNLEALTLDLELKVELVDSKFVAGDYWLAPVREAEHVPDSTENDPDNTVLAGSPPEGIVHHYLRLARVEADGTVDLLDNDDAEKRRHNFPPLTDLWASDVDYKTDCDEEQELFYNFAGTVKEALDKVCDIQAKNVGFTETCNTSIYLGQTVATVEDALKLLCDIQAGQISYQAGAGCTYLDSTINTVQAALDALCAQPVGGGCKVTVGEGGVFNTLEEAINGLLSPSQRHICLCLLPGTHRFKGRWENVRDRFNLSITGCGAGSKVILEDSLTFIGLTSLKLENFAMDGMANDFPLTVERCSEVDIINIHHVGLANEAPLIRVIGGERIRLEENILEAYTAIGLKKPQQLFDFDPELVNLYAVPQRDDFLDPAAAKAEAWAQLHQNERRELASKIESKLKEVQITLNEEVAYRYLVETLALEGVDAQTLLDRLREVRDQAHHAAAGRGVIFMDALASVALEDNTIFGSVSFYGDPGTDNLDDDKIKQLAGMLQPPAKIRFQSSSASLQAWENRITRLSVGFKMISILQGLKPTTDEKHTVQGLYRTAQFESNIIAGFRNQLLFENLTLAANDFQTLVEPYVGWVVGRTTIYTGNRVRRAEYTDLSEKEFSVGGGRMQTAASDTAIAANLPKDSW